LSAFNTRNAGLILLALVCAPIAQAQSLPQVQAPWIRMRPVPQPDAMDFVNMESGREAFIMMQVRVGADGVVREATPIDGFYTSEQAAHERLRLR
jgi:hypothetical protein